MIVQAYKFAMLDKGGCELFAASVIFVKVRSQVAKVCCKFSGVDRGASPHASGVFLVHHEESGFIVIDAS